MGHNKQQKLTSNKKSKAVTSTDKPSKERSSNRKKKLSVKAQGRKNHLNDNSSDDENDSDDDEVDETKEDVDWSDVKLSESLISHITDDEKIKQALFPSPGAHLSTSKGGGKPKTDYHWQLADLLFSTDFRYAAVLAKVKDCTDSRKAAGMRRSWGVKIKNRLKKMEKITKAHKETMGETGAGISNADEIDMDLDNPLTNAWALIKESCPWFFEMRDLIGERPNIVPSGLGNGTSEMDMSSFLGSGGASDAADFEDPYGNTSPPHTRWGIEQSEDEDEEPEGANSENVVAPSSRKDKGKDKAKDATPVASLGRTSAKPGNSRPAERPTKSSTKKRKADEFATIAEAEEITKQSQLDVQKVRIETKKAKLSVEEMKLAYKMEKLRQKEARRQEKREERAIRLRILQQREQQGLGGILTQTPQASSSAGATTPSDGYYAAHPPDQFEDYSFMANIPLAGPSGASSEMFSSYSGNSSGQNSVYKDAADGPLS